jgi:hypothetical protein
MTACPAGHDSATTDYCDTCGAPMPDPHPTASPPSAASPAPVAAVVCPSCGTSRTGRFCENCGHDHSTVAPVTRVKVYAPDALTALDISMRTGRPIAPAEPVWSALVLADRSYYDTMTIDGAETVPFPVDCPQRQIALTGSQIRIGRRSISRGVTPEIDLSQDPGISHLHAVLLPQPDGDWHLVDPGSTNGTLLNDHPDPITVNVSVPLRDGDHIHLGAWTTIVIIRKG